MPFVTWPPATQNFMTARIVGDQSWIIGFARARLRTMEDRRNNPLVSGPIDFIHHQIGKSWHDPLERPRVAADVADQRKRDQQLDAAEQPVDHCLRCRGAVL